MEAAATAREDKAIAAFQPAMLKHAIHPQVLEYLVRGEGVETNADMRTYVTKEMDIMKDIVLRCANVDKTPLARGRMQASKIRQWWDDLQAEHESEQRKMVKSTSAQKYNEPMEIEDIDDLRKSFFRRYHIRWQPEVTPGNLLISRIRKELLDGQLTCHLPQKAKSMMQDQYVKRKHEKVSDTHDLVSNEYESTIERGDNLYGYLQGLELILRAMAIAGSSPTYKIFGPPEGVVQLTEADEKMSTDPTDVVLIPLDVWRFS